jgi:tetratricopeptide (TPR) repeat protein
VAGPGAASCAAEVGQATAGPAPAAEAAIPGFAGGALCASCHPEQARRWRGSHHDLAMQEAREGTVLGDFAGAAFSQAGVSSRFFRRDGAFFVRTEGPDGELRDYEIAYAFGVHPLQQYLVRFPGGRLQALGIAWDSRRRERGGQRWFSLYPGERIVPGDPLHWTGRDQNWNHMCAECHSTQLEKRYLPEEDRFDTRFAELDVSCEACHGPGAAHVAWARGGQAGDGAKGLLVRLGAGDGATWSFEPGAAIARRSRPRSSQAEIEICARCHSRRSVLFESYVHGQPLLQTHRPALLQEGLYHSDGQIQGEVYEYGSFLQSRMYASGVTCSDCHDPHALAIEGEPDRACLRCHRPERFQTPAHHFHAAGSRGARCVECHMPAVTYMVVDPRRDHSLRVPRPDLSLELATPNACTGCHRERSDRWALDAIRRWYGQEAPSRPHFGAALHAGRRGLPGAERALAGLALDAGQPGIARATALWLLRDLLGPDSLAALERSLGDADPLVRMAAAEAGGGLDPRRRALLLGPLLGDPIRAVRIEAARGLAGLPREGLAPEARSALERGLAELRAAQRAQAERPEAHLNLGLLHAEQGDLEAARAEYREALRLDPAFAPALVNLADLERIAGRDAEGERWLRQALRVAPDQPDALHALGLLLVRRQRPAEALELLRRAAELAPERARYAYVYAVALHSEGESERAVEVLGRARQAHPGDPEILLALATIERDRGEVAAALRHARALAELRPGDPGAKALVRELEARDPGAAAR